MAWSSATPTGETKTTPVKQNSTTTNSGGTTVTNTTGTSTQAGSSSNWINSVTKNMSPAALAALESLISQLSSGGTAEQKKSSADRQGVLNQVKGLMEAVSKDQAFNDAKGLMALNVQQSMEKNMPAISRSVAGAGTSASSMQALLSQQLVRDSSLAASSLGAQQEQAYAAQRSNLANTLEALTRENNPVTTALLQALGVAKGSITDTTQTGGSSSTSTTNSSSTGTTVNSPTTSNVNYGGNDGNVVDNALATIAAAQSTFPNMNGVDSGLPTGVVRDGNSYSFGGTGAGGGSPYVDSVVKLPEQDAINSVLGTGGSDLYLNNWLRNMTSNQGVI
jgi:hypothetical protein